jgi:Glycine-zipper domain
MFHCFLNQSPVPLNLGSLIVRLSVFFLAAATLTSFNIAAGTSAIAETRYAQYYPQQHYGYPPPGYRPPCNAVTPGPFQGAGRGAAGGALIGAISGNAGRGAAIGAGFGALRSAVRQGSARNAGACY